MRQTRWLSVLLWPAGFAAVVAGFVLLFDGDDTVPSVAVISRSIGGSFIFCGLIAWQRRPDNRTGRLMALTGFLFLGQDLLGEIDRSFAHSLGEATANWWAVPFAALVLGFPNGRLSSRIDRFVVWGFVFGAGVLQLVWLLFLAPPAGSENVLLVNADAEVADAIGKFQLAVNATLALAMALVGASRWLRAPPALRRLLLPTLAGSFAALILSVQIYYELVASGFVRVGDELTAIVLVLVPLAYLAGILRAQLARAGMADLVVALQEAPDPEHLRALLAKALGDPSLELVHRLPDREGYVDGEGRPVEPPAATSGRAVTPIEHHGEQVATLVHDAAVRHEPDRLEIVCAAANVALERKRLRTELESRVEELAGSRARVVQAGDAARRRIERDLHDGAQQRLISLGIALRLTEDRIREDPDAAAGLVAAARKEVSESLEELRELARGIHPAVLEHGLDVALQSLASRSPTPVSLELEVDERLPQPLELAAYFVASEALANVGKYARASRAAVRVRRSGDQVVVEVADDGVGGADAARGSGLRGLADRVEALGGRLRVVSPAGGGTVVGAELPLAVRPTAR